MFKKISNSLTYAYLSLLKLTFPLLFLHILAIPAPPVRCLFFTTVALFHPVLASLRELMRANASKSPERRPRARPKRPSRTPFRPFSPFGLFPIFYAALSGVKRFYGLFQHGYRRQPAFPPFGVHPSGCSDIPTPIFPKTRTHPHISAHIRTISAKSAHPNAARNRSIMPGHGPCPRPVAPSRRAEAQSAEAEALSGGGSHRRKEVDAIATQTDSIVKDHSGAPASRPKPPPTDSQPPTLKPARQAIFTQFVTST